MLLAGCPQGFHGPYCESVCDCVNGAKCDPETGQCLCKPGYHGDRCEKGKCSVQSINMIDSSDA